MNQKRNSKVTVISMNGSIGKSTYTKHALVPLIAGAARAPTEDWNSADGADLAIKSKTLHSRKERK